MDNLSAQQKLMGNMQATSAELLSGIMEERGRGFASDREAEKKTTAHRRTASV